MVSPSVQHAGAVRVNGTAAYIAAESVDVTVNAGLFDITVLTGTGVANAITHTGSTGGPASTGGTDNQKIYMVAVPKNQAILLTLQGSAGFEAATDATIENGEIILSAGHNVSGSSFAPTPVAGSLGASVTIDAGTYTSDVRARAVTDASARTLIGNTTFNQDVTLIGSQRAFIAAENGRTITILGNATVSNARGDTFGADPSGSGAGSVANFGSEATIQAVSANSFVDIRGTATLDASVRGLANSAATGGRAEVFAATNGRVEIDGAVTINADGRAGATGASQNGPNGTGGRAAVQASAGGTIVLNNNVSISSVGLGGVKTGGPAGDPNGIGTGGLALVEAFNPNSAVTVGGLLNLSAEGIGAVANAPGSGGAGRGGTANISAVQNGTVNLNGTGTGTISAIGRGGFADTSGQGGGDGTGGSANVRAQSGGAVNAVQAMIITAAGVGGAGNAGNGGNGGVGTGGLASLFVADGRVTFGTATVTASGTGGAGESGGEGRGGGLNEAVSVNANGGAFISARRGQLLGTSVTVDASAFGGSAVGGRGHWRGRSGRQRRRNRVQRLDAQRRCRRRWRKSYRH
jgi:hypothetical protein